VIAGRTSTAGGDLKMCDAGSAGMCFAIAGYGAAALHSRRRQSEPRDGRMIRVVDHKG